MLLVLGGVIILNNRIKRISLVDGLSNNKRNSIFLHDPKTYNDKVFIYFHALPGNPLVNLIEVPNILCSLGYKTIAFNYPGLWDSPGFFDYPDIFKMIKQIISYVNNVIQPESILLFGESFGGAISVQVVGRKLGKIEKVVLKSPILDFRPILAFLPQTFSYLVSAKIMRRRSKLTAEEITKNNPTSYLSKTNHVPFWGVIGLNDEVLPAKDMVNVCKPYAHIKLELWKDFPHNDLDIILWDQFKHKLIKFLESSK